MGDRCFCLKLKRQDFRRDVEVDVEKECLTEHCCSSNALLFSVPPVTLQALGSRSVTVHYAVFLPGFIYGDPQPTFVWYHGKCLLCVCVLVCLCVWGLRGVTHSRNLCGTTVSVLCVSVYLFICVWGERGDPQLVFVWYHSKCLVCGCELVCLSGWGEGGELKS